MLCGKYAILTVERLEHQHCVALFFDRFTNTGTKKREYTNATTTGLVNAQSGCFDEEVVSALKLPKELFPSLSMPGETVGKLRPEIAAAVGGQTEVVLCATHDTASAVEAIEGEGPYISSGTWSLLGVKTERALTDENSRRANWTNEGGVGYVRYQKNIMGLWLVQSLRRELCPDKDFGTIAAEARASAFDGVVDVNDNIFLAPDSMAEAISSRFAEGGKPVSESDFFRCAFLSLARGYKLALDELSANVGKRFDALTIVGGGAKNAFLNRLTEEICKVKVNALPIEATAIGNLKIQKERYDNE